MKRLIHYQFVFVFVLLFFLTVLQPVAAQDDFPISPPNAASMEPELLAGTNIVSALAYSSDGRWLAAADALAVQVWDAASQSPVATVPSISGSINRLEFIPNSTSLVYGTEDGIVQVWDVASDLPGQRIDTGSEVQTLAVSPNGQTVAVGNRQGTGTIYDLMSGDVLGAFGDGYDWYSSLAFSPDGTRLATSGTSGGSVQLWDAASGEYLETWSAPAQQIIGLAYSPDGVVLAGSSDDGLVYRWDTATGNALETLTAATPSVLVTLAFNPSATMLAASGCVLDDRSTCSAASMDLWDLTTGEDVFPYQNPLGQFTFDIVFSPNGGTLASAMGDVNVTLWRPTEGSAPAAEAPAATAPPALTEPAVTTEVETAPIAQPVAAFTPVLQPLTAETASDITQVVVLRGQRFQGIPFSGANHLWFSRDGRFVFGLGYDPTAGDFMPTVRRWDLTTGEETTWHNPALITAAQTDGRLVGAYWSMDSIQLRDMETEEVILSTESRSGSERDVIFNPDGSRAMIKTGASVGRWGVDAVELWDVTAAERLAHFDASVYEFSADGERLIVADDPLQVVNARTGETLITLGEPGDQAYRVLLSADGSRAVAFVHTPNDRYAVRLWHVEDAALVAEWPVNGPTGGSPVFPPGAPRVFAFSVDGSRLVIGSDDGRLRLIDTASGVVRAEWADLSPDPVDYLRFTPDGSVLISANNPGTIHLWNVGTLSRLANLQADTPLWDIALSPDGTLLASASISFERPGVPLWGVPAEAPALQRAGVGFVNSWAGLDFINSVPAAWNARGTTPARYQVSFESRTVDLNSCAYEGGHTLVNQQENVYVTITDLATGSVIAAQTIYGQLGRDPYFCPDQRGFAESIAEHVASTPDVEAFTAWFTGVMRPLMEGPAEGAAAVGRVAAGANLRAGTGTDTAVIGGLAAGESFDILGRNAAGDWLRVRTQARPGQSSLEGWLFAALATSDTPVDSLPVVP